MEKRKKSKMSETERFRELEPYFRDGYLLEEISEISGLSESNVRKYASMYNRRNKNRKYLPSKVLGHSRSVANERLVFFEDVFEGDDLDEDKIRNKMRVSLDEVQSLLFRGFNDEEIRARTGYSRDDYSVEDLPKQDKTKLSLKERQRQIKDLSSRGFSGEEVSKITGLALITLYQYGLHDEDTRKAMGCTGSGVRGRKAIYDVFSSEFERKILEVVRDKKELVAKKICEEIGISPGIRYGKAVFDILQKHEISKRKRMGFEDNAERYEFRPSVWLVNNLGVDEAIERNSNEEEHEEKKFKVLESIIDEDAITCKQISEYTGLSKEEVEEVLILEDGLGIEIERSIPRKEDFEEGIEKGLTLEDIAREAGVTREGVRQYISKRRRHDYWEERKRVKKVKEQNANANEVNSKRRILNLISKRVKVLAEEKGPEYVLAVEADRNHRQADYGLNNLAEVFRLHENGESYSKISKLSSLNTYASVIRRIIEGVGLKANFSYRTGGGKSLLKGQKNPEELRQAVINGRGEMSVTDIAYFTQTSEPYIGSIWEKESLEKIKPSSGGLRFASCIYEAVDAGFSVEDGLELGGYNSTDKRNLYMASKFLRQRKRHEGKIIRRLKKMFPDREIDKPYVSFPEYYNKNK